MVERFNAVARRGNLDLEVWFSARTEEDRSWDVDERSWIFRYRYLPGIKGETNRLAVPLPFFRGRVPGVFVSLYASPSFLAGSAIARVRGARTAFWVEVTFDAWVARRRWKEALKAQVLPRSDAILTAGEDGRRFAIRYGVSPTRIFVVPHVIDFEHYARGSSLTPDARDEIREQLGLHGVTFMYAGRLWRGKGLDYLLDAFAAVQRTKCTDVSLLVAGDGVDEDHLRARCAEEGIENVVFTGFQNADSLPRLYATADVFVFPTLGDPFGMVVPEAMACGLPVIATSASGEIRDRITEDVNGFIVPPANSSALRDRMMLLAEDRELRAKMAEASRRKVAGQTPDVWAEAFEQAIEGIVATPRGRRHAKRS
jgi:glycosyltransferase involved in cell wall biosynthesis